MMRNPLILGAVLLGLFIVGAAPARADVALTFEGPASASAGTPLDVQLNMKLTDSVNAVRFTILVQPADARMLAFDDSSSVVRLWMNKPAPGASGSLRFEGIIPGGIGPAFTDVVSLGVLRILVPSAGTLRLTLADVVVYANQPNITPEHVTSGVYTVNVHAGTPSSGPVTSALTIDDADVRIVREAALNGGSPTLIFTIRTSAGTVSPVRIRERFLGLFGQWRLVDSPVQLSDGHGLSIIDVTLPVVLGGARVATKVQTALKVVWAVLLLIGIGIVRWRFAKRR